MTLKLLRNTSRYLELRPVTDEDASDTFSIRFGPAFDEVDASKFAIIFDVVLVLEEGQRLAVHYCSYFESSEAIVGETRDSHFVKANAAAIAFPFLRAFIAQVTLLAGYKPVVVPSLNFIERAKDPQYALTLSVDAPLVLPSSHGA